VLFCYKHSAKVSEAKLMNGGGGRYITVCAALFVSSCVFGSERNSANGRMWYTVYMCNVYVCMYVKMYALSGKCYASFSS
jgi:hypothetical protein